jgi:hypothetical protein
MKNIIVAVCCLALLSSCGQDKSAVENAEKEVFVIHDEIMPQMTQLMEYKSGLSAEITKLDSLLKISSNDSLQKRKDEALAISSTLQDADKAMMDWMHDYRGDSLKALNSDEALKAMDAEKTRISAVREKMREGMDKAKTFLGK